MEKTDSHNNRNLKHASWKITRIYLVMGSLWILLSDKVVEVVVTDTVTFQIVSSIKGWVYVWMTAFILYRMIKGSLHKTELAQFKTILSYRELAAAHEALEKANVKLQVHQGQLRHMSLHDDLTGLPNRRALFEQLKHVLNKQDGKGALFFIDLDNFKYINDSNGHAIGDELLNAVSKRLKECLVTEGELYRLGGDEYVILLKDMEHKDVHEFATHLHSTVIEPFELPTTQVHITISTGIVLYPEHGTDPDILLKHADIAMYQAKEHGANSFMIFDEAMLSAINERLALDQALREALQKEELSIVYQPQYEIASARISGFEALLRWENSDLGAIPPAKFIPIAEQSGLIIPIGQWVLANACQYLRELHAKGYTSLNISINVSILELVQPNYVDRVSEVLKLNNLAPQNLELEITESALMESNGFADVQLDLLRKKGIRIALDDFGTGYSSLNYLRKLPIDTLKIDKVFVDDIGFDNTGILIAGMIQIAKLMDLSIVAEGVEKQTQLDFLASQACDKMQGYLYSKPVSKEEALAKLEADRRA